MFLARYVRAAPRGMLVCVIIAFALLCGLGVWQLQRLHWKEGLIADMARTEALPPVAVKSLLGQAKPSWRSARLPDCEINDQRLIYMHSEVAGEPGYRVLTACPLGPGEAGILVDLGFVADKLKMTTPVRLTPVGRLRPFEKAGMVTPVNRPSDDDWYWRSAADMGKALNTTVRADYFVVLDLKASQSDIPGMAQGPLTAPLANRHFEYALTWFGLAFAMLGIFISVVIQRARASAK